MTARSKSAAPPARRSTRKVAKAVPDPHAPPEHLRPATGEWFRSVLADFQLEPHHVRLLTLAAEAWDRAEQARELLLAEGITYSDQNGNPRKHPAVSIEENARTAFARLLREIDLDGEPLPAPRPPRRGGR